MEETSRDTITRTPADMQTPPQYDPLDCTEHAVSTDCTEHAVSRDCTEHAVSRDCTEHAVSTDRTEHAVSRDCTEHAVSTDCTEHAVSTERLNWVTVLVVVRPCEKLLTFRISII